MITLSRRNWELRCIVRGCDEVDRNQDGAARVQVLHDGQPREAPNVEGTASALVRRRLLGGPHGSSRHVDR